MKLKLLICLVFLVLFILPRSADAESWVVSSNFPSTVSSNYSFTHGTNIFSFAGANDNYVPNIYQSSINDQAWNTSNTNGLFWHSGTINNDNLYILGGATFPPVASSNTVNHYKINNNSLILQNNTHHLPQQSSLGNSTVINSNLIYAGGFINGGGYLNQIYKNLINSDGSLNTWTNAGTLPDSIYGFGMINIDNTFLIIGGRGNNGYSQKVYKANLDSNSNVTSWSELTSLPKGVTRSGYVKSGNTIFVIGGETSTGVSDEIYYAEILPNGELSQWEISETKFPRANCCSAVVESNGFIFVTGGHDGSSYFNTVHKISATSLKSSELNVPLIKQTSAPWSTDIYDHALKWMPQKPTIFDWGCAITSAVMVMKYHGLEKLPDGSELTPRTLNTWLSQNNGYINGGNTDFASIARLSKLMKTSGYNPNFPYSALEFSRINTTNTTHIQNDIENGNPAILEVKIPTGSHFVVAKGIQQDTFSINDPGFDRELLSNGYNNVFFGMRRLIPSNTDLSYIISYSNQQIEIEILDENETRLQSSVLENSLESPFESGLLSGIPFNILQYAKPITGDYILKFSSSNNEYYSTQLRFYDIDGTLKIIPLQGYISSNSEEKISLFFDKNNLNNIIVDKNISYESIISDINTAINKGDINEAIGRVLINHVRGSQYDLSKRNQRSAVAKLKAAKTIIDKTRNTQLINNQAKQVLSPDLTSLLASIQ